VSEVASTFDGKLRPRARNFAGIIAASQSGLRWAPVREQGSVHGVCDRTADEEVDPKVSSATRVANGDGVVSDMLGERAR